MPIFIVDDTANNISTVGSFALTNPANAGLGQLGTASGGYAGSYTTGDNKSADLSVQYIAPYSALGAGYYDIYVTHPYWSPGGNTTNANPLNYESFFSSSLPTVNLTINPQVPVLRSLTPFPTFIRNDMPNSVVWGDGDWSLYLRGCYWRKIASAFQVDSSTNRLTITVDDPASNAANNLQVAFDAILAVDTPTTVKPSFTDNFTGSAISYEWFPVGGSVPSGTIAPTSANWSLDTTNHVLKHTSTTTISAINPNKLLVADRIYHKYSTVTAKIRFDAMGSNVRAGVCMYSTGWDEYNVVKPHGLSLILYSNTTGQFLGLSDDYAQSIVQSQSFTFTSGQWYWFKLRVGANTGTGSGDVVYGKVWADGTSEPGTWNFTYTGFNFGSTNFTNNSDLYIQNMSPGIYAGLGNENISVGSFDVSAPTVFESRGNGLTVSHPTLSDTATVTQGPMGTSALSKRATFTGRATAAVPVYHGTGSPTIDNATITGAAEANHIYGYGAATANHPQLSVAATNQVPVYSGSGTLTINHPTLWSFDHTFTYKAADYTIPLYIYGHDSINNGPSGVSLYIGGVAPVVPSSIPLFIKNWHETNESMNLFLKTLDPKPINNNVKLFIDGADGVGMGGLPLYIDGYVRSANTSFNLFIENKNAAKSLPLFMRGNTVSTTYKAAGVNLSVWGSNTQTAPYVPLYIQVPDYRNSNIPLVIKGPIGENSSVPLVITGKDWVTLTRSADLFLQGPHPINGSMNLFLKTLPMTSSNKTLPLLITGSVHSGVFSAMPLSIQGIAPYSIMNLFVHGKDSGALSEIFNLAITGGNAHLSNLTPLFVQNNNTLLSKQAWMYISGAGMHPNYIPVGQSMNLFVKRGPNAGMTLFIKNENSTLTAPLFIHGGVSIATAIGSAASPLYGDVLYDGGVFGGSSDSPSPTLFIGGYGDIPANSMKLFVSGVIPTGINNNVQLTVPNVVDVVVISAGLYTNGFNY